MHIHNYMLKQVIINKYETNYDSHEGICDCCILFCESKFEFNLNQIRNLENIKGNRNRKRKGKGKGEPSLYAWAEIRDPRPNSLPLPSGPTPFHSADTWLPPVSPTH
jgi:hypothetical protein